LTEGKERVGAAAKGSEARLRWAGDPEAAEDTACEIVMARAGPVEGVTNGRGLVGPEMAGPAQTGGTGGGRDENRARSRPWRKPPSETRNSAIRGEATSNRKTLRANSETARLSNEDPNQN
jgi:hypothetical protein